ncbi:MAG: M3 family metallopeptidase [Legionellaceae bacterium]|nr:M3 family metallopeptidase [Legionellaceae bacterium]
MNTHPNFSKFEPAHFPEQFKSLLKHNLEAIDALVKTNHLAPSWDSLMHPLDDLDDALSNAWSPLAHLNAVMHSPELREAYQACLPELSAYESAVHHNQALFQAIKALDTSTLDATQQKIIADTLRDFELAGVALPHDKQTRFEAINSRLAELSNQFDNNVLDAVAAYSLHITDKAKLAGLPEHAIQRARACAKDKKQEGWLLNLEIPCYLAVITYADDRELRQTMHEAYATRASDVGPNATQFDNTTIISEILALRHEQSQLLGFKDYAEHSLVTKMAETPAHVFDFISDLATRVLPEATREVEALREFAREHCGLTHLEPWDVSYVSQKKKEAEYALNDEALRPYFPLPHVIDGMFGMIQKLYGIYFENITAQTDTWHPDVQVYALRDEEQKLRGYVYMDLFARPNKRGGAWMDSAQSRRKLANGDIQLPIAFLTCNFAKSATYSVPTLSHDEVITLFHEMGHCLHHLLTQVDYLGASGIHGVEWDAVELPSQFFENFCWDPIALKQLSAHVETGQPLPDDLFKALLASKQFQAGLHLIRQLEFAWFDFLLHADYPGEQDNWLTDALNQVRKTTQVLPQASYHRAPQSFSHIFAGGYAAGYYSYLWAEMLSSDAFARFEEDGVFNAETGREFLTSILAVGSSQTAREFFKNFRGRDATPDAFLRHHGITT